MKYVHHKDQQLLKLLILLAYIGYIIHINYLYFNPVGGYVEGVFWGMPSISIILYALIIICSVLSSYIASTNRLKVIAATLTTLTVISLIGTPLVRGYYYMGNADALGQIGRTRSLASNTYGYGDPSFIYPGLHTVASFFKQLVNFTTARSLLLSVFVFAVIYISSTFIFIRYLSEKRLSPSGIFGVLLILPISYGTFLLPHASTMLILFSPLVIYLYVRTLRATSKRYMVLFIISVVSSIFIHPRQFTALLCLLLGVLLYSSVRDKCFKSTPSILIGVLAFIQWVMGKSAFLGQVYKFRNILLSFDGSASIDHISRTSTTGPNQGIEIIIEFLVKMFFPDIIYILLVCILIAKISLMIIQKDRIPQHFAPHIISGFIFASVYSFIFFIIGVSWTRFYGFLMVPVTILGSLLIIHVENKSHFYNTKKILSVVFILLLIMSSMSLYQSPYRYQESEHVSQTFVEGYEMLFEYKTQNTEVRGIRKKPRRYRITILGMYQDGELLKRGPPNQLPDHFRNENIANNNSRPVLVPVTDSDKAEALDVRKGARISQLDFAYLNNTQNKIYSNGGMETYSIK